MTRTGPAPRGGDSHDRGAGPLQPLTVLNAVAERSPGSWGGAIVEVPRGRAGSAAGGGSGGPGTR